MVNPNTYAFIIYKTKGPGSPADITSQLSAVGSSYTDTTGDVDITRTASKSLRAVFTSGMTLDMQWIGTYGNIQVSLTGQHVATSRGIMGVVPGGCKLHVIVYCPSTIQGYLGLQSHG